jgi:hypothetical protein
VRLRLLVGAWSILVATLAHGAQPRSEIIYPAQKVPLKFSHARHLKHKIECDFCHEKAPGSRLASDDLIPTEEVCSTCHPIDHEHKRPKATPCATCHVMTGAGDEVARVEIPPPNLRFDHKAHVDKSIACTRCHGELDQVELATRMELPTMAQCLQCHNSRRGGLNAPSRCATCHATRPDGTVETVYAQGVLRPSGRQWGDAHTLDFRVHHAQVARDEEKYCLSCHRQDFCLSCHNGVVKPLDFHGNDYIDRHAIDARKDNPTCNACHRAQTFCLGCHERLKVVDLSTWKDGAFQPVGPRTFHPEGWAAPTAAGQPNHHAWQAQRNIRTCVSCHRQETCLQCHSSRTGPNQLGQGPNGKMQVNPHPAGWIGSQRCESLRDRNPRVCLQCHGDTDPHLRCR